MELDEALQWLDRAAGMATLPYLPKAVAVVREALADQTARRRCLMIRPGPDAYVCALPSGHGGAHRTAHHLAWRTAG